MVKSEAPTELFHMGGQMGQLKILGWHKTKAITEFQELYHANISITTYILVSFFFFFTVNVLQSFTLPGSMLDFSLIVECQCKVVTLKRSLFSLILGDEHKHLRSYEICT